jgi:hypothetical protein
MRYSVLAIALAGTLSLFADTENQVRRSIPVNSPGRLVVGADWGAISVQPGTTRFAEVEVYFRGHPRSRAEFDRMLRDFTLDVSQAGTEVRVNGRFKDGWRTTFGGSFWDWFNHAPCHDGKCLEYTWLRQMEYRVSLPREFSVDLSTSGGSISVGDLKGEVSARTSGGSLSFGRIEGPVDGRTSGGSISLAGGKGKAVVHTSGGAIRIEDVGQRAGQRPYLGGQYQCARNHRRRRCLHVGRQRFRQSFGSTEGGEPVIHLRRQHPNRTGRECARRRGREHQRRLGVERLPGAHVRGSPEPSRGHQWRWTFALPSHFGRRHPHREALT